VSSNLIPSATSFKINTIGAGAGPALTRLSAIASFELGYLVSLFRDPQVTLARKADAVIEAAALSFDPRIRNELFFPGDRSLYFQRINDLFRGMHNPAGAAG
jgi:hypothetical protein